MKLRLCYMVVGDPTQFWKCNYGWLDMSKTLFSLLSTVQAREQWVGFSRPCLPFMRRVSHSGNNLGLFSPFMDCITQMRFFVRQKKTRCTIFAPLGGSCIAHSIFWAESRDLGELVYKVCIYTIYLLPHLHQRKGSNDAGNSHRKKKTTIERML